MRKPISILFLWLAVLFLVVGCGSDGGDGCGDGDCASSAEEINDIDGEEEDDDRFGDDTEGGYLDTLETGATVDLDVEGLDVLSDFLLRPLNNPSQVQVNIDLEEWDDGKFGGTVRIGYEDDNRYIIDEFSAGKTLYDVQFNHWYTDDGEEIFQAFFEDEYGGLIVVIDGVTDLGDGSQSELLSGSIWFKNHRESNEVNPSTGCYSNGYCPDLRCWFISSGPYECQSFVLSSGYIDPTAMVEPNNGYTKLGEFNSLSRADGFNE